MEYSLSYVNAFYEKKWSQVISISDIVLRRVFVFMKVTLHGRKRLDLSIHDLSASTTTS